MTPTTRSRRLLARQRQLFVALSLFASSAIIAWTYLFPNQAHLLSHPLKGLRTKSWYWGGRKEDWDGSKRFDGASEEEGDTSPLNEWDMTCHEAVERDMRVAVYDFTPFHDEVVGSMISTLNDTGIRSDVYRDQFIIYKFSEILDTFLSNPDGQAYHWWDHLYPKLEAGEYDASVLTSCDEYWIETPLLKILETLTRIPIICLHHEIWSFKSHRPRLINSARAGKLTFFTLGEHVNTLVKEENLEPWFRDGEDGGFDWAGVPAEVYVPIFPLPESIQLPSRARLAGQIVPNDVAIIGNVNHHGWRKYNEFWADLMNAMQDNPAEWGYTVSAENGHFIPTASSDVQPFRVHIFGVKEEGAHIPPELEEHIIVFHSGLEYVYYYRELSRLDLVLPILGSDPWNEYIRNRATAAFPAGIIARIPSLVTPQLLKSYTYLEAPAVIVHPDGTSEVDILAAMRRGEGYWTPGDRQENGTSGRAYGPDMRSPLLDGYLRGRPKHPVQDWEWYVSDVRAYNAKLLCKALLR